MNDVPDSDIASTALVLLDDYGMNTALAYTGMMIEITEQQEEYDGMRIWLRVRRCLLNQEGEQ